MPRLHDQVVVRVGKPTKQLPGVRIALASLEDPAEPVRYATPHGHLGVRMKARNRTTALGRMAIDQVVSETAGRRIEFRLLNIEPENLQRDFERRVLQRAHPHDRESEHLALVVDLFYWGLERFRS